MTTAYDERIVSMQFDNADFEKNARQTIDTLGNLEESLKFENGAQGIEDVRKAVNSFDASAMESALYSVGNAFNAMDVIGTTVLVRLTNAAINAGLKIGNALTSAIKNGGITRAMNIEQAKFQLTGLKVAWDKILPDIEYGVKDTAYGLDSAAKLAAQLSASGIKIGEDMKAALRGTSGVAAMTNSSYDDIARIFAGIAGANRVFAQDLNSLAARGLNVAATLGESLGKTEAEIRDMVSDGKIDFATFSKAMDEAFGEHAKDANKTFTGALSNMKAALSRIGADVASVGLDNLRDIFNALRVTIDDAHNSLKPFIETLNSIQTRATKGFVDFVELKGLENILHGIGNIFSGLLSILTAVKNAFVEVFPPKTVKDLANTAKTFELLTENFIMSAETAERLKKVFVGFFSVLKPIVTIFTNVIKFVVELVKNFKGLDDILLVMGETISNVFGILSSKVNDTLTDLGNKINTSGVEKLGRIFETIKKIVSSIGGGIGKFITDFNSGLDKLFNENHIAKGFSLAAMLLVFREAYLKLDAITSMIKRLGVTFGDFIDRLIGAKSIPGNLDSIFNNLRASLYNFNKSIKFDQLKKIATSLLILSAALLILSTIDSEKLKSSLSALTMMMTELFIAYGVMDAAKWDDKGIMPFSKRAFELIALATAITIMAGALKKVSDLDIDEIKKGLLAIGGITAIITAATVIMNKFGGKGIKGASQFILLAISIKIMASALDDLASIKTDQLKQGLGSLAIILAELAVFMKLTNGNKRFSTIGINLVLIAASMKIFASAIEDLSSMNMDELKLGLGAMAVILAELAIATKLMNPVKLIGIGAGLLITSVGLSAFYKPLKQLSEMNWDNALNGMKILAANLAILAVALKVMTGTIAGAAALLVAVAAINLLIPAIEALGSIDLLVAGKALLIFAVSLGAIAGASMLLAPVIPIFTGLAGALALFGLGCLAVGAGIFALGAGLTMIAGAGAAAGISLATAITTMVNMLPVILFGIKETIIGVLKIISECSGQIADTITTVVIAVIKSAKKLIPVVLDFLDFALGELISFIQNKLPTIIETAFEAMVTILETIVDCVEEYMPIYTTLAINIGKEIIIGIVKGVGNLLSQLVSKIGEIASTIFTKFKEAGSNAIQGFIDGLKEKYEAAKSWAANLGTSALDALKSALGIHSPSVEFAKVGAFAVAGLVKGFDDNTDKVTDAAEGLGDAAKDSLASSMTSITDIFSDDLNAEPTITPVLDLSKVREGSSAINSMLNGGYNLGLMSNVGSISYGMNSINQNDPVASLMNAIGGLKDSLSGNGDTYIVNGITYDDGSNISNAVQNLVDAARIQRRI